MKYNKLLIFTLISFFICINACSRSNNYSEEYVIVVDRKKAGKLIINEKTDIKGNLLCLSEQKMDTLGSKDKKQKIIKTKTVFQKDKFFPVSYSYEASMEAPYDVNVDDGQIIRTLKKTEGSQIIRTPHEPGIPFLDINAFHTIDYLFRKYDFKKGGRQVFKAYLLPLATIEKLSIIPGDINIPDHNRQAKNFEIKAKLFSIILWLDKDNRLYRIYLKNSNVEVIRTDLFEKLNNKIKQENKKSQ